MRPTLADPPPSFFMSSPLSHVRSMACRFSAETLVLPMALASFAVALAVFVPIAESAILLNLDFGDAPNDGGTGYPTLLTSDGARHVIVAGFMLGATIDGEPDGQPTAAADGDGSDDDGVTFTTPFVRGTTALATVTVCVPVGTEDGYLEAWIDFNHDGDWLDDGEHVVVGVELKDGSHVIAMSVPSDALPGGTYARFRWSSKGGIAESGLGPGGGWGDGEVEDYFVTIVAPPTQSSAAGGGDQGTGGHRNHETNRILAALGRMIVHFIGTGTPPPAFGGTNGAPLSEDQKHLLKRVDLLIGCTVQQSVFHVVALEIASSFGGDVSVVEDQMRAICDELSLRSNPYPTAARSIPRTVELDGKGYPVSSDALWNLCVRNQATLEDFRRNTVVIDRDTGKTARRTCGDFRISGTNDWKYPDDPFLTITIARTGTQPPHVSVPKGYVVAPFLEWTAPEWIPLSLEMG